MSENIQSEVPAEAPGLTIADLTLVLQVLQATTARGAYKAEELTVIGGLYDRVFKFLDSVGAILTTPSAEEAPAEEAPAAETTAAAPAKK